MNSKKVIMLLCILTELSVILSSSESAQIDKLRIKTEADSLFMVADSLRRKAWQLDEALPIYEVTLEKYRLLEDGTGILRCLDRIGIIYYTQGEVQKAKGYWEEVLSMFRADNNRKQFVAPLLNLGRVCAALSEFQKALDYYSEALIIAKEFDNRRGEAHCLNNIGVVYIELSNYPKGLEYYQASLEIWREVGSQRYELTTLYNIGIVYFYLADYEKALAYARECLTVSKDLGDKWIEANCYTNIGADYRELSRFDSALTYHLKGLELLRELGDKSSESFCLDHLGNVHLDLGDYSAALNFYNQSLELRREIGDRKGEGISLGNIGDTYSKMGNYTEAQPYLLDGLTIALELQTEDDIRHRYHALGEFHANKGEYKLACENLKMATDIAESIRGQLEVEQYRSSYTAGVFSTYEVLVCALLQLDKETEAYYYNERARARSFLDLLASSEVTVGKSRHAEFLQQEEKFYSEENALGKQITKAAEDTIQISLLRGQLDELRASHEDRIAEKKLYEPELASLITVNALTLPEVQAMLDPKVTLIEYFLTEEKTLIWLVTNKRADVLQVDIGGDSLKTLVEGFRAAIKGTGAVEKRSKGLYDLLIAPVENEIKTKNLVIVPHGILHYLPFQALQNRKGKYLIEKYKISYLPSASVMKYLEPKRRPRGKRLLAFGNPMTDREGYGSIPQSEQEVQDLAELYETREILTGEDAKESKFKELAPNYDILHLACHGELNSAYPLFSGLLLTPGEDQDGELDVYELFTLDLNAYLVVLSACETGLGHLTTGDELVGLSRAFIYAGTPSVISSLWQVKDESTAYLMKQFYSNLQKYNKVDALRKAQLKTKKKYDDVVSWASFVLIGDRE